MKPRPGIADRLEILSRPDWQMTLGERAALEGIVSQVRPALALEIGSAEGGSLERIAAHSESVHAIDLTGDLLRDVPANVHFHEGDSKIVLPRLLESLAAEGRQIDFALVDGDHSREGALADLSALLGSPVLSDSVILVHDSFNPEVRAGIEAAGLADNPRVVGFDLDFVTGRLGRVGAFTDQLLGGFALVVVGPPDGVVTRRIEMGFWSLDPDPVLVHDSHAAAPRLAELVEPANQDHAAPSPEPLLLEPEGIGRAQLERELAEIHASLSWRITAPLRALRGKLRRSG